MSLCVCLIPDNVELILKSVGVRHGSDGQDNDQPDYDSVASDEDTDQELPSSKGDRTKVMVHPLFELRPGNTSQNVFLISNSCLVSHQNRHDVSLSLIFPTEPGLRPLRWTYYYAGVFGGEKCALCL